MVHLDSVKTDNISFLVLWCWQGFIRLKANLQLHSHSLTSVHFSPSLSCGKTINKVATVGSARRWSLFPFQSRLPGWTFSRSTRKILLLQDRRSASACVQAEQGLRLSQPPQGYGDREAAGWAAPGIPSRVRRNLPVLSSCFPFLQHLSSQQVRFEVVAEMPGKHKKYYLFLKRLQLISWSQSTGNKSSL